MDISLYVMAMAFAAIAPLPSGFALGYLASERRTRDGLLLAAFSATLVAGATPIWFVMESGPPADLVAWFLAAGFLIGGIGLGALGGLAARALGLLGWIMGISAAFSGLGFASAMIFAFVFADLPYQQRSRHTDARFTSASSSARVTGMS